MNILEAMKNLVEFFAVRCPDRSTLDELHAMISDPHTWDMSHGLFHRIRLKTLEAERRKDRITECQYAFEEACAKTLFNLTGRPAGFDPDSPYWIVPNALALARRMSIEESEVTKIVVGKQFSV